jgi:hypothetical protein
MDAAAVRFVMVLLVQWKLTLIDPVQTPGRIVLYRQRCGGYDGILLDPHHPLIREEA